VPQRIGAQAIGATALGYPRIGPRRELKRATEDYWAGRIDRAELEKVAADLRAKSWRTLAESGLDSVPGNTFSYYDHVLDAATLFGAVPRRFAELGLSDLDTYFAMARGREDVTPLEMTKWFDTNYHYLVPELGPDTKFALRGDKPVAEFTEAKELGVHTRPVVLGPVSFLLLSKRADGTPESFRALDLLDDLLTPYLELLSRLKAAGADWVQLDESAFVTDRDESELVALREAYRRIGEATDRPALLVTGSYGELGPALPVLAASPVEAIGVDLVTAPESAARLASVRELRDKTVVAGVVDGRNIWRTDLREALSTCASLLGSVDELAVATSCSLLHVPHDLDDEQKMPAEVKERLAFAKQKLAEVVTVAKGLGAGTDAVAAELAEADRVKAKGAKREDQVRSRVDSLHAQDRDREPYVERAAAQQAKLGLPPLATTTIGSFPQTGDIRKARAGLRTGKIDEAEYQRQMRAEIERVIRLQEEIGLDVLVHGEPERNDMVQYFAEHLDGFVTTEHGWVQSYGSRCVRPPILHGDVSRPEPITVPWSSYAQSLTDSLVKGMLTGPVTILAWSFVRDDQPLGDTANQVALALRDEIGDLENAGIRVVQVDEPALRELLPPRAEQHKAYLDWAVGSFRLATAGASETTQIHTHLCYSEFGDVIGAIDGLDADVTTLEAARSRMEVLDDLAEIGFRRGVGPGVYDIHSPRVPDADEMEDRLNAAVNAVPGERLWVNPDCGLKTRGYDEVDASLRHMVDAAKRVRARA
jgi:5-methyltetrahydropteroyltriglutamate--homocysteine methyltransferase